MPSFNTFYVIRNLTLIGDGVEVASGVVPVTSPALFTSGAATDGTYKIVKCPPGGVLPQGASVTELLINDAKIAVQGDLFTGGTPTTDFIAMEQAFCQEVRRTFMAAQAGLSVADGDALFTALEPTSHALSAGSVVLAYFRFNDSGLDQPSKDAFNPLFEDFFMMFPRDLT